MQVSPGYKATNFGIFPDSWSVRRLEELADPKVRWSFTGGPFGSNLKSSDYTENGVRIIQLQNIGDGFFKNYYEIFTSYAKADELVSCNIYPGEIILSKMGDPVARACIIPALHERYLMCSDGIRLAVDQNNFDPYFVLSQINDSNFRNRAANAGTGSTRKRIGLTELRLLELICPPIVEQHEIAKVLSDLDIFLESLSKLIAKKQNFKQAVMQKLLTRKIRLPGYAGEWKKLKIRDNATIKARIGWQALTTNEYLEIGEHYLVTGTDFIEGRVNWSSCCFVSVWRFSQDKNIQLANGDVLVTKDGTIGKVGFVDNLVGEATLNSGIFVIRPKNEDFYPLFLFYILRSKFFKDFIAEISAGSTITHLYQKDFVNFAFEAPDINEQIAISQVLSDLDDELSSLERRREKVALIKQGMIQELLTGRTRLI
jgi:type I restriction enzyme, S subunit